MFVNTLFYIFKYWEKTLEPITDLKEKSWEESEKLCDSRYWGGYNKELLVVGWTKGLIRGFKLLSE